MSRRDPRSARLLGLWTAGCLFVLLLAGVLRLGDLSLQWPVLLVPVLWALVALRPRRRAAREYDRWGDEDGWEPIPPSVRTDTVERPAVPPRDPWR
ncbi:hypothetical protein [Blastococcus sp. TF02A-30]|uniref:hypothetical protein n=1 Tax=Blastococcus sp. TF02A-30 TaxID=2250580 RepID=UPI000DEB84AC|nr:hypothetical protein [Blastococcus sp. TF02A-30]RBY89563.1 hypothetical protein DQ241_08965 [Blastococcus sp. TF02A-30]